MDVNDKEIINSDLSEIEKKPLITFAKLNKYFIIPFLSPIFLFLATRLFSHINQTFINDEKLIFIDTLFWNVIHVFVGLFYLIYYFKLKLKKKEQNSPKEKETNALTFIYNGSDSAINNPIKVSLLIILISILYELSKIPNNLGYDSTIPMIFYFLLFPLFSKLILKENIYKHQNLSIIISIFGWVFYIIPECLAFNKDNILPSIYTFIYIVNDSLFLVLIKYLIQKYYISPLKISFFLGITSTIIHCIGFIIYSHIKYHDLSYFNDCFDSSNTDKLEISLYFIGAFLSAIIYFLLTLSSLFYFSPNLIIVTNIIYPFLLFIYGTIRNGPKMPGAVLSPIGLIICLFSSLIYNEIIILNFCDLSKNTIKFVKQRVELEEIQVEKDEFDDDIDRTETLVF